MFRDLCPKDTAVQYNPPKQGCVAYKHFHVCVSVCGHTCICLLFAFSYIIYTSPGMGGIDSVTGVHLVQLENRQ